MKKFLLNRSYKKLSRFILAILFLGFSMQLYATHFRYGYWSWSKDPTYVGPGFKINFKLTESWRRGFPWNQYAVGNAVPPNVGNIIDFGGNFPISFGDGSPTVNVLLSVTSMSVA